MPTNPKSTRRNTESYKRHQDALGMMNALECMLNGLKAVTAIHDFSLRIRRKNYRPLIEITLLEDKEGYSPQKKLVDPVLWLSHKGDGMQELTKIVACWAFHTAREGQGTLANWMVKAAALKTTQFLTNPDLLRQGFSVRITETGTLLVEGVFGGHARRHVELTRADISRANWSLASHDTD